MMPDMKVVFLDLDGTLTDVGKGILNCVSYALDKMDLPPFEGEGAWMIGPPLWDSFRTLGVPEQDLDRAVFLYRERYEVSGWLENGLYDGILEQLAELKDAGYRLCLATAKPLYAASKITAHYGIAQYLTQEFGSHDDGGLSDKTSLIAHGMATLKVKASDCIMVGDRKYDIIGARNNGLKAVGTLYGYGSLQELTEAGAEEIITHPSDLARSIKKHLPTDEVHR